MEAVHAIPKSRLHAHVRVHLLPLASIQGSTETCRLELRPAIEGSIHFEAMPGRYLPPRRRRTAT